MWRDTEPGQTSFDPDQALQLRGKCIRQVIKTFHKCICTLNCFCLENILSTIDLKQGSKHKSNDQFGKDFFGNAFWFIFWVAMINYMK